MDSTGRDDSPDARNNVRLSRAAALFMAIAAQAGVTLVQQGVVIVGVFFVAAYHLTLTQMGAVVSLISVGWMVSALFTGMLIDSFGSRIVQFSGTLLMSACCVVISLTQSLPIICVMLVTLGLGVSVTSLTGTVMVINEWPREARGLPLGLRQMGVPLGSMLAAFFLPSLAAAYDLSGLFRIFAIVLLVMGVAFGFTLPKASLRNSVSAMRSPMRATFTTTLHEMRQIVAPGVAGFLLAFGQYTVLSITIPMLHANAALTVALAGVVLAMAQVGGAIARGALGFLVDRIGGRLNVILIGCALLGAALALLVGVIPLRLPVVVLALLWLAMGVTMVGWNALILLWVSERVQQRSSGAAVGLTTSSILLGAICAPPFMGFVIQTTRFYGSAWLALAGILLLAGVVMWWGFHRMRPIVSEEFATSVEDEALMEMVD